MAKQAFKIFLGISISLLAACRSDSGVKDPAALGRLAAIVETSSEIEARKILASDGYDQTSFSREVEETLAQPDQAALFAAARSEEVRERLPQARTAALDGADAVERVRPVLATPVSSRLDRKEAWD